MNPPLLRVRVRERLHPDDGEQRQIAEVLLDGEVVGQLPFTRAAVEILPGDRAKLTVELIVDHADIVSYP